MSKARRTRRSFTDDFKHELVTLSQSGESVQKMAEKHHISPSVLHNWIRKAGVQSNTNAVEGQPVARVGRVPHAGFTDHLDALNKLVEQGTDYGMLIYAVHRLLGSAIDAALAEEQARALDTAKKRVFESMDAYFKQT